MFLLSCNSIRYRDPEAGERPIVIRRAETPRREAHGAVRLARGASGNEPSILRGPLPTLRKTFGRVRARDDQRSWVELWRSYATAGRAGDLPRVGLLDLANRAEQRADPQPVCVRAGSVCGPPWSGGGGGGFGAAGFGAGGLGAGFLSLKAVSSFAATAMAATIRAITLALSREIELIIPP
jgi:hypothetical protein